MNYYWACSLAIMDTVSLLYRGVLYVEVILYSKECNWYTSCCPLNGGVRYRECPLERLYCNMLSCQNAMYMYMCMYMYMYWYVGMIKLCG